MKKEENSPIINESKYKKDTFRKRFRFTYQWEIILFSILVTEFIMLRVYFPKLLQPAILLGITINFMEVGLIALPMAYVIISKNIDISVGSMIALISVVLSLCVKNGISQWIAIIISLAAGIGAGLFNGFLCAKMKIPALVVTLGTFSLYRGIAYVILGDQTYHEYPETFLKIGRGNIAGIIPVPLLLFIFFAIVFFFLLHKTTFGRKVYSIGNNQKAALYSGVKVDRIIMFLFSLVGFMTAIASVVMTARNASTRGNMATGLELDTITSVVLGGVSIGGGKGNIIGVVVAVFVIGILRNGMYARNISPEIMKIVIGGLLIMSLLIPKFIGSFKHE